MATRTNVLIAGAGQNGAQAFHILRLDRTVRVVGFVDDDAARVGSEHCGLPVLGTIPDIAALVRKHGLGGGIAAVGDNLTRARLSRSLREAGLDLVRAVHPLAMIDDTAQLAPGVMVEMGAAVHFDAVLAEGVFLGGHAVVAHHSTVGRFALIGGGVVFGGAAHVGAFSLMGVGTALQPHVRVGAHVVTGVATAITKDVPDHSVVVGVPGKVIRTNPPPQAVD